MNNNALCSDLNAVEKLFRQYYKTLRTYAFRFLNDRSAAEDVVQDVFFELWNKRKDIHFDGAVKAYLFTSVYHKSLNYLNNKTYTTQESIEYTPENKIVDSYLQSQALDQESMLIMEELEKEINVIIDTLPDQCKKVFLLSRTNELKNKEIADQLGISTKAVEKHITKALSILRTRLDKYGGLLLFHLFFV